MATQEANSAIAETLNKIIDAEFEWISEANLSEKNENTASGNMQISMIDLKFDIANCLAAL